LDLLEYHCIVQVCGNIRKKDLPY